MTPPLDERALVERILAGDEAAVGTLVDRYHVSMALVAGAILGDPALAKDAVQEAWIRILGGLERFEFRAQLKTWILRITANTARTLASRQPSGVPAGLLVAGSLDEDRGPTVDPARFTGIGRWRDPPRPWPDLGRDADRADQSIDHPERALLRKELRALLLREIDGLPPNQRLAILLRDVEELPAGEVCETLGISDANLRVLLHRGRARLRAALAHRLERENR